MPSMSCVKARRVTEHLRSFGAGSLRRTGWIEGVVNDAYEAVVALSLKGPGGRAQDIEAERGGRVIIQARESLWPC